MHLKQKVCLLHGRDSLDNLLFNYQKADEKIFVSKFSTRGPNGPDIAHLGILPQFGQNYLVVIVLLSLSCSVLLLVKADGDHLAVPNCK